MITRRFYNPQFDLFLPSIVDLRFRDQKDTMERPFFSLSKSKRMKPIEYGNESDGIFVTVQPHQDYGMATIWDADILIWAASVLCDLKNRGRNDNSREIKFQPHDLLKAIGRSSGGRDYAQLRDSLERLKSTVVTTNIRVRGNQKRAMFSWIDQWDDLMPRPRRAGASRSRFLIGSIAVSWRMEECWQLIRRISPSLEVANAGFTASHANMQAETAQPVLQSPCRRSLTSQAQKARIAASNSRCCA
jgi:plasmid replication initiation protein